MPLDIPSIKAKKQARMKKFLEKSRKRREAFLKKSREKGYLPKDFMTPAEKDRFNKKARKVDAQTADEVGAKKMKPISKKARDDYKDETAAKTAGVVSGKELGAIDMEFDKILKELTTKKRGGGKVKGYKKGGPITYRMTGGQVVDNSYD